MQNAERNLLRNQLMDRKSRGLFDVVGKGDESTLQRLLLEDKEERNIATLAVSLTLIAKCKNLTLNWF